MTYIPIQAIKTDTATLIKALRILAQDIQSDDGVANAAIAEAADRLEGLEQALKAFLAVIEDCDRNYEDYRRCVPDILTEAMIEARIVLNENRDKQ